MSVRSATLAVLALVACSDPKPSEPRPAEPKPAAPVAVAPPVPAPIPPDASPLAEHMVEHFTVIVELQRAIALGQLDEAKRQASWLIDHDLPAREGWPMFVDDMKVAAREVVAAGDLPTASVLAARLGRTCSRCHERQNAVVTFAWEPAPEESPRLVIQMQRHEWAALRLWEGLVGPSDEMWSQGAGVLASSQLDTAAATKGVARGDVPALAARVRQLAIRATTTTDHDQRATLYGELLSTCAGCHQLVRPTPVSSP